MVCLNAVHDFICNIIRFQNTQKRHLWKPERRVNRIKVYTSKHCWEIIIPGVHSENTLYLIVTPWNNSVSITNGFTVVQWIPSCPSKSISLRNDCIKPLTAYLVEQYSVNFARPSVPRIEATATICPWFFLIMAGRKALVVWKVLERY